MIPPRSIPATRLIAALMDVAGIVDVVLTEDMLARVQNDVVDVVSSASDPSLRPGVYLLRVKRQRSPIVVAGSLAAAGLPVPPPAPRAVEGPR